MGRMRIAAASFGILVVSFQPIAAGAADTKLFTTNGVRAVLNQIRPQFERETGNRLDIQYGAGPVLKKRIEAGEAFDVAVLPLDIGDLISQGKIIADTRVVLGRTGYGAAVRRGAPKSDVGTADSLKRALLNAKLVAYAAEGVSGTYFLNLLNRLGIAAEMQSKIKPATAASGSMAAVVSGEEILRLVESR